MVGTQERGWHRDFLVLMPCLLLSAWVHRLALEAFFTSPDDLIHLQQAAGLLPILPSPFRFLSQVLYFRAMFTLFGPNPVAFHAVTMLLHLANVGMVFVLARYFGVGRPTAALAAALFGMFPLLSTLLSSAVGINDELALTFALAALLALRLSGLLGWVVPVLLFVLGMLCKESVILLPLLPLVAVSGGLNRSTVLRQAPMLGAALLLGVVFLILRPLGLAPGGTVYATQVGANLFHNLMTYLAWSVNLRNPLPDLVTSFDPQAWPAGIAVVIGAFASLLAFRKREPAIRIGLVWFLLGLLPVLPLVHQTYRHYLYPALPGLALIASGATLSVVEWLVRRARGPEASSHRAVVAAAIVAALAYAGVAEALVRRRFETRITGTDLALDPVQRRREVAQRAMDSFKHYLPQDRRRIAVMMPEGSGRVFGARSGREVVKVPEGVRPYNLLEESIDRGRAVRLFCPWVDSVAFVAQWTPAYNDFDLFLPYQNGYLLGVGSGAGAHAQVGLWMMQQHLYPQARDHLSSALEVFPDDHGLRLGYGAALFKTGERSAALAQLRQIVRDAPADSTAAAARALLAHYAAGGE